MTPPSADDRIARGFDRLAPVYDLIGDIAFGGSLRRSQNALLTHLPAVRRALVLGGGSGRFLADLMKTGKVETAVSIDLSSSMTRRAMQRISELGFVARVEFRTGTVDLIRDDERFDLVVTHCFLDLFGPVTLESIIGRLARGLAPCGHWLFSDFSNEGGGPAGAIRRGVIRFLYRFFRATCRIEATTLPDFNAAFTDVRLTKSASSHHLGGMLQAVLYQKDLAR